MDLTTRQSGIRVGAQHLAKQAVELTGSAHTLAASLEANPARAEVETTWVKGNIRAIRAQLDELEAFMEGREPTIPCAPRLAMSEPQGAA